MTAKLKMIALACSAMATVASAQQTASIDQRAAAIVARMTLDEKAGQLRHKASAIPRLNIPAYNWWSEGLHGVARAGNATVFPQAIGLAATFDAPLIGRVADTIATEFRAKYVERRLPDGGSEGYRGLTVWSPNINIFRDPRWGRGQETFGEDPFLTSRIGVAFIRGLQGSDPTQFKTIATAKHFAVHSGPESDRHREDVHPSPHDLEDTYLPAFRAAVTEGKAQAVMCAYNAIDTVPACGSPLLQTRLRHDWGFKGHIVSDCAAIADFFRPDAHLYSKTPEAAVAAALNAGTDLICAEFDAERGDDPRVIVRAVRQGLVSEAVVDRAVQRLVAARLSLGLFGPPGNGPYSGITKADNDTPAHRQLATEAARASLVLLKNNGLLPLKAAPRRIAVIGPNADSVDALVGNYNGTPSDPVTVLAGIKQRYPTARVDYVEGIGLVGPTAQSSDAAALDAARAADLVIFVGGLTAKLEGEEMKVEAAGFAGGDRTSIDLPAPQQALLERLHATGKPVVLVLMNGSALAVNWADRNLPAIVEAWYPGETGGRAVADLIAGDFSPSGRLPVTFYTGVDQLPAFKDYAMGARTYRYFAGAPLYSFGHGLSYTRFSYAKPVVARAGDSVTVDITNAGSRAGDEVAQLYLSHNVPGAPIRALAGMQRVSLKPGETRSVTFALDARALSLVDAQGRRAVTPGTVDIWIGGGQPGAKVAGAKTQLRIAKAQTLPL
jgi:beta-glucosidase